MLTILFTLTCVFSNGLFITDTTSVVPLCSPSHTLSRTLSLSLSLSLRFLALFPFFPFWCKIPGNYQLNNRFWLNHCSHFKGNINMKIVQASLMMVVNYNHHIFIIQATGNIRLGWKCSKASKFFPWHY
jgi:hypothetical protein